MSKVKRIKGFADMFSPESDTFTFMESVAREVFGSFGYKELRTPILERTELFKRSIGDETDVVQKEMYTFDDRKGRSLTMRP
ncbi:MAG: ATP phosphoribosyltransferase regulatory subunit, partial [Desulfovibrionales bacterium]|nr:ATP phosphoribosyltransferase regulatory subunit [Desulfovibrionales bacterium]